MYALDTVYRHVSIYRRMHYTPYIDMCIYIQTHALDTVYRHVYLCIDVSLDTVYRHVYRHARATCDSRTMMVAGAIAKSAAIENVISRPAIRTQIYSYGLYSYGLCSHGLYSAWPI